ncbi:General transcription factor 3C polypeptide 2 [Oryzias melastigma]|uniref:General transcription factor 3C polypeptide 2 n=1 Tax=Oryzias melastigma TaxID=30732 RepID=A0A834C8N7_ORYME|nr:General transcription factor 3C polypeptide 2 [Oryzias melastigma]
MPPPAIQLQDCSAPQSDRCSSKEGGAKASDIIIQTETGPPNGSSCRPRFPARRQSGNVLIWTDGTVRPGRVLLGSGCGGVCRRSVLSAQTLTFSVLHQPLDWRSGVLLTRQLSSQTQIGLNPMRSFVLTASCSLSACRTELAAGRQWVRTGDLDQYLPQELQSAAFRVSREGLGEQDSPQLRLNRFHSLPAHSDRWDMVLFTGGPVWALEWCPTPDGAPARQYVAVACHAGMDDLHLVTQTPSGPGLVQLWDCGELEYNSRPDSPPALVYGLAQDRGFIWGLKWCPSGAWEPPASSRKAPHLPRLGLLAVASSSAVVSIYSLPHPDALLCSDRLNTSGEPSQSPGGSNPAPRAVVTLRLGSIRAPRQEQSGMALSLDWLPQTPHNLLAVGFYEGVVGLWDLTTASALLRVREPDRSLSLLPHRCFLAQDHAVRALAFCPASRHLLATAGGDRHVKVWDLRRRCDPVAVQKRFLTNEICWPLTAPGLLICQECAFVAKGSHGLHFISLSSPSYFAIPRNTTVWSITYSEWLNVAVSADVVGELILSILPQLDSSGPLVKRNILRRFPICFTSMVPLEGQKETAEGEEEGGVEQQQEKEEVSKEQNGSPDGGKENQEVQKENALLLHFQTYKEGVQKYGLHYADSNV